MDQQHIITTIRNFLEEENVFQDAGEIDNNTDLIDSGVIDSLALVMLVGLFEEEFNCALEPEELVEDNFRTLDIMASLVSDRMEAA